LKTEGGGDTIFCSNPFHLAIKKKGQWRLSLIAVVIGCAGSTFAQTPKPAPSPSTASTPSPSAPAPAPAETVARAISLPDVATQAEAVSSQLRKFENKNRINDLIERAEAELPGLGHDLSVRGREMQQVLGKNATLETIRNLEEGWRDIELRADATTRDLTRGALQLDGDIKELEKLESTWDITTKAAIAAKAPQAVLDRTREVANNIAGAKKQVLQDRAKLLGLQGKSADIGARATESRQVLAEARERAVARLLYRDSLPLTSSAFWSAWIDSFSGEAREDLLNQGSALVEYVNSHLWRFASHALFFLGLTSILSVAQASIRSLSQSDTSLRRAGRVFEMPLVSAMLIAMLVSAWFYPRAPRIMWVLVSVLGAAPVFVFVRRMIDVSLYPVLWAVTGFYLIDTLRDIFAPLPGVSRVMLLAETLFIILFCCWMLHRSISLANARSGTHAPLWRVLRLVTWIVFFVFVIALLSNIGGYVRLADLFVRSTLGSAYTAVVLYALMRVGEGISHGLMYMPPVSMLGMVKRHKMFLISRIHRLLRWAALIFWIALTLQGPGMLQPFLALLQSFWKAAISIGTFTLSVENIFVFFFILWAAYTLSRIFRFILDEEVFPKLRLERGLPYAVTTMLHYIFLFSGLVLAVGAIGVDMTKFTIVASAFSVGIGFGLQNIVNNFVSGLIVLFERPIKVGDVIQIDDITGRVQRIGIRASVVRSTTGSEVIIPNGKLISDKVTNWTLTNQLRQLTVPVITKPDIDVAEFKILLLEIARKNKAVVEAPAPEALFIKRGLDTFEFELRVWTGELDAWIELRSDLITEVNDALRVPETPTQTSMPTMPD
jgi:potassium-dependent mechanosensitive channel